MRTRFQRYSSEWGRLLMRIFRSNFAPVIQEYLEHRKTLGYSNHQEYFLARFDIYCSQHFPDAEALTKRIVRSWFSHEISLGGKGMHGKISAVRMLDRKSVV